MKNIIIVIIVVIIIAVGGYFLTPYFSLINQPVVNIPIDSVSETQTSLPQASQEPSQAKESENEVIYSNSGYFPKTITIKAGQTVIWKNQSSKAMWTASAMHPTHRVYPTTGGCLGSTFDACRSVLPGESWSFKFDIIGAWKYHNHVNPSDFGTIIVE